MARFYNTTEFARLKGETVSNIRQLCERGRIPAAQKINGPSQGMWLIPEGAEIIKLKRGRKKGWRKDEV